MIDPCMSCGGDRRLPAPPQCLHTKSHVTPGGRMTKRVLTAATAEILSESNNGDTEDGWTRVGEQEGDSGRWSRYMELIVAPEDAPEELYALAYELGLTENQEHDIPWRGSSWSPVADDKPMDIYRVWPITKTITEYTNKEPKA